MRILLVHNFYSGTAPSGENVFVNFQEEVLKSLDYEVFQFFRTTPDRSKTNISRKAVISVRVPWNSGSLKEIERKIEENSIDLVIIHNTFPMVSSSILSISKPILLFWHNYRRLCAQGNFLRSGSFCNDCQTVSQLRGIKHGCYHSAAQTAPIALENILISKLNLLRKPNIFHVALSDFQRKVLIAAGIREYNILSLEHGISLRGVRQQPTRQKSYDICYVGRFSYEKGFDLILRYAVKEGARTRFVFAGSGPMLREARQAAASSENITILENASHKEVLEFIAESNLAVVPSRSQETFNLAFVEAFSNGVPVLASDVAHFPEWIKWGLGSTFRSGVFDDFSQKLREFPQFSHLETMSLAQRSQARWGEESYRARLSKCINAIPCKC